VPSTADPPPATVAAIATISAVSGPVAVAGQVVVAGELAIGFGRLTLLVRVAHPPIMPGSESLERMDSDYRCRL